MTAASTPWTNALTSARRAIHAGQQQFRQAAQSIARGLHEWHDGDAAAPARIIEDIVELSEAAQTVKAGAAVVRADREIGEEILGMVRRDPKDRHQRDTSPHPGVRRRKLDILV